MGKFVRKHQPWHLSKREIDAVSKMSRDDLERAYIAQAEQIKRFLRVMKKLGQSIAELQVLGF